MFYCVPKYSWEVTSESKQNTSRIAESSEAKDLLHKLKWCKKTSFGPFLPVIRKLCHHKSLEKPCGNQMLPLAPFHLHLKNIKRLWWSQQSADVNYNDAVSKPNQNLFCFDFALSVWQHSQTEWTTACANPDLLTKIHVTECRLRSY